MTQEGEAHIANAYSAIYQGDFIQAVDSFKKAIEADPDNASYYYRLSITYARNNQLSLAIECAERAYSLRKDETAYAYHLRTLQARSLCKKAEPIIRSEGNLFAAIRYLQKAERLDPLNSQIYLLLGLVYAKQGNFSRAIHHVKRLLKLDPNHEIAKGLLNELKKQWNGV